MKLFKIDRVQNKPAARSITVAAEIEHALVSYSGQKQQKAKGLVLGLETFRKLKEQNASKMPEHYRQMAIIVDTTQQSRISVF